ncbi:MAG: hypothetical protein LUF91_08345 [Oscillospiraceae bacterium]|nr:hypothetical protein [Oscillospiraceae bacterium]
MDNFYNLAVQIYGVYYGEGTSEYDEHVANLNSCKSDFITTFVDSNGNALADGALLMMTTSGSLTGISGETGRSVGENNELLNALVMVLSATPYLDDNGDLPAQYVSAVLTAEDFIAEGDDYCYRILAEPTCMTYCSTREFYLTTMRDIFTLQEIYYPS